MDLFIADASVLIDYLATDLRLLGHLSRRVGTVYVLSPLLAREVPDLSKAECARHHLVVIQPELAELAEAASRSATGGLSFYDWLNLIVSKNHGWVCLTADGAFANKCRELGVKVQRGLWILLKLVEERLISAGRARKVAAEQARFDALEKRPGSALQKWTTPVHLRGSDPQGRSRRPWRAPQRKSAAVPARCDRRLDEEGGNTLHTAQPIATRWPRRGGSFLESGGGSFRESAEGRA